MAFSLFSHYQAPRHTSRVLIAFKNPKVDNPSACHVGLGVTASNVAESLNERGFDALAVPVIDGYYLRDGLRAKRWCDVTHVVMCAPYIDTAFLDALTAEFPGIQFVVVFHSNVGFLQADNWAVKVMREQMVLSRKARNFHLAGNCQKFKDAVEAAYGEPCRLLPNLYFLHGPIARKRGMWKGPDLRIGIFGATRVQKNLMTGAWAAIQIGRQLGANLSIHISTGREEGGKGVMGSVRQMLTGLQNVRLVEEPWLPWLDFRRSAVRRMHLLMQPSYTESFNGVTADGIAEGVPSVVSPSIDWVPKRWIADPDRATDLAAAGIRLLRDKHAERDGYRALEKHNTAALAAWREFLK